MAVGLIDVSFDGDVFERAIAAIMIQNVFRGRQAARAAHHRRPFPDAGSSLAGCRRGGQIKIHVVRHNQIKKAVTVVIYESAA